MLNALKWPISFLQQILITKGEIFTLLTLGGPALSEPATIKTCISNMVSQALVNIFHCPKFELFFPVRLFPPLVRLTTIIYDGLDYPQANYQLRASEYHLGSVHSESNVYCFDSLTFYLSW